MRALLVIALLALVGCGKTDGTNIKELSLVKQTTINGVVYKITDLESSLLEIDDSHVLITQSMPGCTITREWTIYKRPNGVVALLWDKRTSVPASCTGYYKISAVGHQTQSVELSADYNMKGTLIETTELADGLSIKLNDGINIQTWEYRK